MSFFMEDAKRIGNFVIKFHNCCTNSGNRHKVLFKNKTLQIIIQHVVEVRTITVIATWVILIIALLYDVRKYRVPNWLIGLLYMFGLILNLKMYGPTGINSFLLKALIPLIFLLLLYIMGGLGAGDVKLLSALATMVGVRCVINVFIISIACAGIVVITEGLIKRKIPKRRLHFVFYIVLGFLGSCIGSTIV